MRRRRRLRGAAPRLSACACVLAAVAAVATPRLSTTPAVDAAMRLNASELPPPRVVRAAAPVPVTPKRRQTPLPAATSQRTAALRPRGKAEQRANTVRAVTAAEQSKPRAGTVRTATVVVRSKPKLRAQPLRVLNVTRGRPKRPSSSGGTAAAAATVTTTPTAARIVADVELDQLIIAVLAMLALYCFVALRRGGRADAARRANGSAAGAGAGAPLHPAAKARGATRAQIERHLAHTTVTLYDGTCTACPVASLSGTPATEKFDQQQCAICLELLCKPLAPDAPNSVRILPCAHAFHEACIDPWLLRNTQCPLCLKQPW